MHPRERRWTVEELTNLVQSKTGISEQHARQAVDIVINYLKEQLPPAMASKVDAALKGQAAMGQAKGLINKGLGALGGGGSTSEGETE
jgi:uncharacterized protein (DUF2267 family)